MSRRVGRHLIDANILLRVNADRTVGRASIFPRLPAEIFP
jgi:hypothetical protein